MSDVVVARTVEMFSCWCGEHFLTMSSYAKHVNLHARGEYKHAEVEEKKQENSWGSAGLSSNEKENRSEKERGLTAQRVAERSVVDIDQKLEAAVKRLFIVSRSVTRSVSSNPSEIFLTAKTRHGSSLN